LFASSSLSLRYSSLFLLSLISLSLSLSRLFRSSLSLFLRLDSIGLVRRKEGRQEEERKEERGG